MLHMGENDISLMSPRMKGGGLGGLKQQQAMMSTPTKSFSDLGTDTPRKGLGLMNSSAKKSRALGDITNSTAPLPSSSVFHKPTAFLPTQTPNFQTPKPFQSTPVSSNKLGGGGETPMISKALVFESATAPSVTATPTAAKAAVVASALCDDEIERIIRNPLDEAAARCGYAFEPPPYLRPDHKALIAQATQFGIPSLPAMNIPDELLLLDIPDIAPDEFAGIGNEMLNIQHQDLLLEELPLTDDLIVVCDDL